jgi:molecular chaperone GrpE
LAPGCGAVFHQQIIRGTGMEKEEETVTNGIPQEDAPAEGAQPAEAVETPSEDQLSLMLEDARSKADEHWNQLMRARADMENLRKRQERELENAHKFALERFVSALLPVRDSMELGLSHALEEGADVATLREGAELTLKLFTDVMAKFNVVQVDPQGEPFNPELHQAMSMIPRDDLPPNTVVTVVQKGYTLNDRLVRPAMVLVSQGGAGTGGNGGQA